MKLDPREIGASDAYKLLSGAVIPRPIAWVSTVGEDGVFNVAPFSFFAAVCSNPLTVCFSAMSRKGDKKDTVRNLQFTGDFVVNMVTEDVFEAMNISCGDYPPEVDEFQVANLTPVPGDKVKSPRVGEAAVSMECRLVRTMELGPAPDITTVSFGEVVFFHIKDELYSNGKIDVANIRSIGRLAGDMYSRTGEVFERKRPRV